MQTRQLGNSDMMITPIGLGAWAIGGGGWEYGWGPQDDLDSIKTIRYAIDAGMNWIDTAAVYGLGHSEEIVAKAVAEMTEKPYIFTKCSLVWDETGKIRGNLKADSIRKEVEDSLRRLNIEQIDLYQIHWPNPDPDIEEGWQTLADLQKEGKLRYIAVSNFNVSQMQRCQPIAPITSLQPPYSMIERTIEDEILPFCGAHHIGVIVYSPMQSGLLTGKMTRERIANLPDDDWRKRDDEFTEPRLSRNLELVEKLKTIAEKHNTTVPAVAVAWTLHRPEVTAAIVGARRPDQIDGFLDAPTIQLDTDDLAVIDTHQ